MLARISQTIFLFFLFPLITPRKKKLLTHATPLDYSNNNYIYGCIVHALLPITYVPLHLRTVVSWTTSQRYTEMHIISHSVCQVKILLIILNTWWAKIYYSFKFFDFSTFLTFPRHNSAVIERMFRRSNVFCRLIDKNLHIYNVRRWNTRNGICIFIYTNRGACVMNA